MFETQPALQALASLPGLTCLHDVPLSQYTRMGIGGPVRLLCDAVNETALIAGLRIASQSDSPWLVIGEGSNLIVSDTGFDGVIFRFRDSSITVNAGRVVAGAGAILQDLVDFSVRHGLAGLHTMTGIPGSVGAAVYGNAGAYGHSLHEFVQCVRFFDGTAIRQFSNAECGFAYRESLFKRNKQWIILAATLQLPPGDPGDLAAKAREIRAIRDAKYPPSMRCAGSIFKNVLAHQLPPSVLAMVPPSLIRDGKIPSAWFLEQVGAKGIRQGDIQVAAYHANLIYNDGRGRAADLVAVIADLKVRVAERFGFFLEEEVQYVGF
jgi:UDP-N-acetylmuramate dehydrogenase